LLLSKRFGGRIGKFGESRKFKDVAGNARIGADVASIHFPVATFDRCIRAAQADDNGGNGAERVIHRLASAGKRQDEPVRHDQSVFYLEIAVNAWAICLCHTAGMTDAITFLAMEWRKRGAPGSGLYNGRDC